MSPLQFSKPLASHSTPIPGVVLLDLPVHGDNRGWFKENWQRAKMIELGLDDFGPVQNNISFNETRGTTRGIHAEPWDKYVSVATGSVFGAWVDLRRGPSFGKVFTTVLDASKSIFIPAGVGNAFQTLEDGTAYTYLVNDHWSSDAQAQYTFLNLRDETVTIPWPIPLDNAELSQKDKDHPRLGDVVPMAGKKTLVLGANGQLGRALQSAYGDDDTVAFATRSEVDITDAGSLNSVNWGEYNVVINAAAYTDVDKAETPEGRVLAWAGNSSAVAALAAKCAAHKITLVHVSSDYVFDGALEVHSETEAVAPLGVYGQTKAAGDAVVSTLAKHYIVRTSWVIGDGANFVATMASLADRDIAPSVVDDQYGRLTFADDLALAIRHLLETSADYGTYNVTNAGPTQSWADIARDVYELRGRSRENVTGTSTVDYFAGKQASPRPTHSTLELGKLKASGHTPELAATRLAEYLQRIP